MALVVIIRISPTIGKIIATNAGPVRSRYLSDIHVKNNFPPKSRTPAGVPRSSEFRASNPKDLMSEPKVMIHPLGTFIMRENET